MSSKPWIVYTDGASRGNPGHASAGIYVLAPDGKEYTHKKYLGEKTNNYAEYKAMIVALKGLLKTNAKHILICADSMLMIKQMRGEYKVKHKEIKLLFDEAKALEKHFEKVEFKHIPREENKKADALANEALDEYLETNL